VRANGNDAASQQERPVTQTKRLYLLAKINHLIHARIAEYIALMAVAPRRAPHHSFNVLFADLLTIAFAGKARKRPSVRRQKRLTPGDMGLNISPAIRR
jgi:hypothetical protein